MRNEHEETVGARIFRSLALIILTLVGICEPLGVLLDVPALRSVGRFTMASNSPRVFNQVGGIEFWANRYRFRIRDADGGNHELVGDRALLARMRGPHTRKAAYVVPIGIGPIAGPDLYLAPLRYGFCEPGTLLRDWGIRRRVSNVAIEIADGSPNGNRSWSLEIPCLR